MTAIAAGTGRVRRSRANPARHARRAERTTVYIAPNDYVPTGTADLWRSGRRFAR